MFPVNTGPARSLRLTSTTVVVDDAYALTGTSHLWRRGMTFDSSIGCRSSTSSSSAAGRNRCAPFVAGCSQVDWGLRWHSYLRIQQRSWAIRQLRKRGGGHRLATGKQERPELKPTEDDHNAWNRDGSPKGGLSSWRSTSTSPWFNLPP
jgi:hypothetical protein